MGQDRARAKVRLSGRVQGVFFRAESRNMARSLGLGGWVRNVPDGTVEAVFEGERTDVEKAVEWCRRGPPGAGVEDLRLDWEQPVGVLDFEVRS